MRPSLMKYDIDKKINKMDFTSKNILNLIYIFFILKSLKLGTT